MAKLTLNELLKNLRAFVKKHPEALDATVYYRTHTLNDEPVEYGMMDYFFVDAQDEGYEEEDVIIIG